MAMKLTRIITNENIGEKIREARIEKDLTITELAELAGVVDETISNYEKNKYNPSEEILKKLIDILGISINYTYRENVPLYKKSESNDIKDIIRNKRLEKKLTQKQLAKAAGITAHMVSYYETGKSYLSYETAIKIANVLEIDTDIVYKHYYRINDSYDSLVSTFYRKIANNIKISRTGIKLSTANLANMIDVTRFTVERIENCKGGVLFSTILNLDYVLQKIYNERECYREPIFNIDLNNSYEYTYFNIIESFINRRKMLGLTLMELSSYMNYNSTSVLYYTEQLLSVPNIKFIIILDNALSLLEKEWNFPNYSIFNL